MQFESLTLEIEVKDVDDLDENWQGEVPCQCAYVCKNGASKSSHLFAVHNLHFVKDVTN